MNMLNSPPEPVRVSWSSLKRWENCPQHQLRVIKHETEKQEKGRIFLPGTVADLSMRSFLDDPTQGPIVDRVETIFNETVERAESKIHWKGNPVKDKENVKASVRQAVARLQPWLEEHVLPFDYAPEHRFKAHMEIPYLNESVRAPVLLNGGIDILVRDDNGKFHFYDLKITKTMDYIRSTLAQLIFYDIAWGIICGDFNLGVEWAFVTPSLEELTVPIVIDHDDRQVMMSRIVKYAQGVWKDNWAPKPDDAGCGYCEAKGYCDKFKMVATVDANNKARMSFSQAAAQRAQFRTRT